METNSLYLRAFKDLDLSSLKSISGAGRASWRAGAFRVTLKGRDLDRLKAGSRSR